MQKDIRPSSDNPVSFFRAYWAAMVWAALILILCIIPGDELPNIDFWALNIEDKIAHMGVFALLAILSLRGAWRYGNFRPLGWKVYLYMGLSLLLFGILTEALQSLPGISRYGSFADVVADLIGIAVGMIIVAYYLKRKYKE